MKKGGNRVLWYEFNHTNTNTFVTQVPDVMTSQFIVSFMFRANKDFVTQFYAFQPFVTFFIKEQFLIYSLNIVHITKAC